MARLGRQGEGILSFSSSAKPPPFKAKSKSKKENSKSRTKHRAGQEQTNPLITTAEISGDAQVTGNLKKFKPMPKPVLLPSAKGNRDGGKDKEHEGELNLNADHFSPAASEDDIYSPLLRFICGHSFMRDKRYPVSFPLRQQFVRDVYEEAGELGYEEKVIDRVLLDIKRYYLTSVGFGAAFSEGAEFGDEVDTSSPGSHESKVPGLNDQKKATKHKREKALTRADILVEKRLVNTTSFSGQNALTPRDAGDHADSDQKGKLTKFQKKRKRKRERRLERSEPLSKAHKGASPTPISVDFEQFKVAIPNREKPLNSGKGETQRDPPSRPMKKKQRTGVTRALQPSSKTNDSRQGRAVCEDPIVLNF